MLTFQCATYLDSCAVNKSKVFLHYLDDAAVQAGLIKQAMLSSSVKNDISVWTVDDPYLVFDLISGADFAQFTIFVAVISPQYIQKLKQNRRFLDQIKDNGMFFLPIVCENADRNVFNSLSSNADFISLLSNKWELSLKSALESFLIAPSEKQEILDRAFSVKLFLSYRKVDRDKAILVMKAIHDTLYGSDASIWFDEFLTPGEDFNDEIKANIQTCDAFIITITPQITQENDEHKNNYVCEIEYPLARTANRVVIPIEAEVTQRRELEKAFDCLTVDTDIIPLHDLESINTVLKKLAKPDAPEKSPYVLYLLSKAYFYGIGVYKDIQRSFTLLKQAYDAESPEAAYDLAMHSCNGLTAEGRCVVEVSLKSAAAYMSDAFDFAEKHKTGMERLAFWHSILFIDKNDFRSKPEPGKNEEFLEYYNQFYQYIDECEISQPQSEAAVLNLWRAQALTAVSEWMQGDSVQSREQRIRKNLSFLSLAETYLDRYGASPQKNNCEYCSAKAEIYSITSENYRAQSQKNEKIANHYLKQAIDYQQQACDEMNRFYDRWQLATYCYNLSGSYYMLSSFAERASGSGANIRPAQICMDEALKIYDQLYREYATLPVSLEYAEALIASGMMYGKSKTTEDNREKALQIAQEIIKYYPDNKKALQLIEKATQPGQPSKAKKMDLYRFISFCFAILCLFNLFSTYKCKKVAEAGVTVEAVVVNKTATKVTYTFDDIEYTRRINRQDAQQGDTVTLLIDTARPQNVYDLKKYDMNKKRTIRLAVTSTAFLLISFVSKKIEKSL